MSNPRGNIKHGGHGTLTYARWKSMMQRCHQSGATNFKHYGAKGITVCERWQNFAEFRTDMGECADYTLTLDRIDNSKGYEPGNCQWASKTVQNSNRSYCIKLTFNGETKILADWAKQIGISPNSLSMRLRLGWTVERALSTSTKTYRRT